MATNTNTKETETNRTGGYLSEKPQRFSDKAPTHVGKLSIDGNAYKVAGWLKSGKFGEFISLAIKPESE